MQIDDQDQRRVTVGIAAMFPGGGNELVDLRWQQMFPRSQLGIGRSGRMN